MQHEQQVLASVKAGSQSAPGVGGSLDLWVPAETLILISPEAFSSRQPWMLHLPQRPSCDAPSSQQTSVALPSDRYGGWSRFQQLLRCLRAVADRHGVSMEAVAVRWAMDQGVTPVVDINWREAAARPGLATFGRPYGCALQAGTDEGAAGSVGEGKDAGGVGKRKVGMLPPPTEFVDAALFAEASFLTAEDMAELQAVAASA